MSARCSPTLPSTSRKLLTRLQKQAHRQEGEKTAPPRGSNQTAPIPFFRRFHSNPELSKAETAVYFLLNTLELLFDSLKSVR